MLRSICNWETYLSTHSDIFWYLYINYLSFSPGLFQFHRQGSARQPMHSEENPTPVPSPMMAPVKGNERPQVPPRMGRHYRYPTPASDESAIVVHTSPMSHAACTRIGGASTPVLRLAHNLSQRGTPTYNKGLTL